MKERNGTAFVDLNGATQVQSSNNDDDDPWALPDICEHGPRWADLSTGEKVKRVVLGILRAICLLLLLWWFVCSLDLLAAGFRVLGGRGAGAVMRDSPTLKNPVVGLMIGVLATVLVQSSSTSTSVVVTMVGTGLLGVREAVPMIMGANIGTSVTNTAVSLGQAGDRREFRRAFAAATIHDMFNWLAVIILLPIEVATGYLESISGAIVSSGSWKNNGSSPQQYDFLKKITKPVTSLIVQLDKKVLEGLASGQINETESVSLLKHCHKNGTEVSCGYLLEYLPWSEWAIGLCLFIVSVGLLCGCLLVLVKVLHSVLGGPVALMLRRMINAEPAYPWNMFTGYAAMAAGAALTVLVQSSSVFTSALTPLAGVGMVTLERIYPLTLGANLGTTTTGLLAAVASPRAAALQIALCHLLFNLSAIILLYPIPATRLPIPMAKMLGNITAQYRWFSILYLIVMYLALPAFVFALSLAGSMVLACIGGPILILLFLVILINLIQRKKPSILPSWIQDWSFLPLWMRSLDPLDRVVSKCCCCCQSLSDPRDAPALGLVPNQSQVNIMQNCSASSSVLTLNSLSEYQTMCGFENVAFGDLPAKKRKSPDNNNTINWDFGGGGGGGDTSSGGSTTAL